jgi:hypothetical protein
MPDGPTIRYAKSPTPDFFAHDFNGPRELMRLVSVGISADAQIALLP